MARPPRSDTLDGWHHVMNRGARHQAIFRDDRDRTTFLGILDDVHSGDGVEIHAYCLMGNHYHLVVHCPRGNLSAAMHHLGSRYAQRFNTHHGLDGPLFRGRFRSEPVTTDEYLTEAVRYVHRNPLELEPAGGLAGYRWSSHAAYLDRAPRPRWLTCSMVLALTGGSPQSFRAFVETDRRHEAPSHGWRAPHHPDLVAIDRAIAAVVAPTRATLPSEAVRSRLARDLALVVAIDGHTARPDELAVHHGLSSKSSVWSAVQRTRARAREDRLVRSLLERSRAAVAATATAT